MTLEQLFAQAVGDGLRITVFESDQGWQVNTSTDGNSWHVTINTDLMAAFTIALKARVPKSKIEIDTNRLDIFS